MFYFFIHATDTSWDSKFSVLKINLHVVKCCQNFSTTEILENEDKFAFFDQKFCLLDSTKEEFICYNNCYRNSIRMSPREKKWLWNAFATVCFFVKIPTGNSKERAIFALYSILLHFSSLEKHMVVEFFENSSWNSNRNYVYAQIYQVDTFKMIVPFLNST